MLQSIKKFPCRDYDNCLKIKTLSVFATQRDIWWRVFWLDTYCGHYSLLNFYNNT